MPFLTSKQVFHSLTFGQGWLRAMLGRCQRTSRHPVTDSVKQGFLFC
jgi:hypothetical protein